ncbi:MAG: leucine--tRNA ligase [Proteobacteria bacterium]|nr:leucine--tRNA ligase [Pseudomonadota bacterium]
MTLGWGIVQKPRLNFEVLQRGQAVADYEPSKIESKWQAYWLKNKTFKTPLKPGAKKLYCLDMFPYPSGSGLHIGHPLGYTATDIYSRFKRHQGYSVLHPMGYDAFGLPAEQHAVNTGEHPSIITFKSCETFTKQMQAIGFSYDWDRELATCTADYYHWTQWIFLKLYNSWFDEAQQRARPIAELPIPPEVKAKGELEIQHYQAEHRLAYLADALVNWCPALGTVLANEEVIDGRSERGNHEVIRKPMRQWILRITKYSERLLSELEELDWPEAIKEQQRNWIGKRRGADIAFAVQDSSDELHAFTTRPDTLFGVTFLVISPEHPLVAKLTPDSHRAAVESYLDEAKRLSDFARTLETRKKTGVFCGSYAVNPITGGAVPIFVADYVLMSFGTGVVMGVPAHDERDFEFARTFDLQVKPVLVPQDQPTEVVSAVLEGEMAWTGEGQMIQSDAKVASELSLEGKSNLEASRLICGWLAKHKHGEEVTTYRLRDWVFSRQRYWGEPIPIIHWEDGTTTALDEKELPLELPSVRDFKPSEGGESPLAKAVDWLEVVDSKTGKKGRRETNTMPQWAGSCWYYLRFIDPKNSSQGWSPELEKSWMPVDLYVGGAEHAVLHLLYARFWHKVLFDLGHVSTREPFKKLFNQGMIQSYAYKNSRGALIPVDEVTEREDGTAVLTKTSEPLERIVAKMSKSLRNVINPTDIIAQYGADTLRLYLMFMGPLEASKPWDTKAIMGTFRFLRRVWNIVTADQEHGTVPFVTSTRSLHKAIARVTESLEGLRFNTAISGLMECLNEIGGKPLSKPTIETLLILLSPLAPHLSEELWQRLGYTTSISSVSWPTFDPALLKQDTVTVVVQVRGKKRATLDVPVDISEDALKRLVTEKMASTEYKVGEQDRFITVFQPGTTVPKLVNVV